MENVANIAEKMARDFVDRRLEKIAENYDFPAVVFFGPEIFVLNDKRDFLSRVRAYRSLLDSKGLSYIHSVVQDVQVAGPDRWQFEVKNEYFAQDDVGLSQSDIRYFVEMRQGAPKIRMVEYLKIPFGITVDAQADFTPLN